MSTSGNNHLNSISFLKLMLILGVVCIHSNITYFLPPEHSRRGADIVAFIVTLMQVCVPSFFVISGYLFFHGIKHFTFTIYGEKLKRRVRTLLIPYVLWNIFCAGLFLFKVSVLHFPGLGIIENGIVDWTKFFEGFVYIQQVSGFPYAFAFWFIRNLIIFIILAPVVWMIARKWWSVALFFIIKIVFGLKLYGIEWFIIGAACSLNQVKFENLKDRFYLFPIFGVSYLLSGIAREYYGMPGTIESILFIMEVVSAFCFLYAVSLRFTVLHNGRLMQFLYSSTFFIYAFHQCFCTVNAKFWIHVYGCETVFTTLAAFVSSFLTLVLISLSVYLMLRFLSPGFLGIITGKRS